MESMKYEGEPSNIDLVKEIAHNARTSIEAEYGKGANSWTACVRTVLQGVNGFLSLAIESGDVEEEDVTSTRGVYNDVLDQVRRLESAYGLDRETQEGIPEDEKEEILSKLESIMK